MTSGLSEAGKEESTEIESGDSADRACPISDASCLDDRPETRDEPNPLPVEIASKQTVTFRITNQAPADRYLAIEGWFCSPFAIDLATDVGSSVPLRAGFQCRCECNIPRPPHADRLRRLEPGETYEMIWDARQWITIATLWDCAQYGGMGGPVMKIFEGALQPVDHGDYKASFGIENALPSFCLGDGPGYPCDPPNDDPFATIPMDAFAPVCRSTQRATVEFTLPSTGDIIVPVAIR